MKKLKHNLLIGLVLAILLAISLNVVNGFAVAESLFYFNSGIIYGLKQVPSGEVDLIIPAEINGNPVSELQPTDGEAINFNNEIVKDYIVSVDLSNATNLIKMGNVFKGCSNLSGTITLPSNLKNIDRFAFSGTSIDKVIVSHTDDSLVIADTTFPSGTKFVFQSEEIMNLYSSKNPTTWSNFDLTHMYELKIDLGDTIITTCKVEKGSKLGELYSLIINQHFPNYENVELYQGTTKVDENLVMDGTTLTCVSSVRYDYSFEYDYGTVVNLTPNVQGDAYTWSYNNNTISTNSSLALESLNVGEYIYSCTIVSGNNTSVIVYKLTINPIKYNFTWPNIAKYEYFEISDEVFIPEDEQDKLSISYFKYDGTSFNRVDSFSIGSFKAVVEPINSNYYIENDSFEFVVDYAYLTIVWDTPTFNYTGDFITPNFYLYGNTKGQIVEIMVEDSVLSAKDAGNYTINVTGLSNPYFALTKDTTTTFNWEIIPTSLNVDWDIEQIEYGNSANFSINGVYNNISIPLDIKGTDGENISLNSVGTYQIMVQIPSGYTGFSLNGNTIGTIEIVPSKLDVVFMCDDTYTYSGKYVEILATITTSISDNVELIMEDNYHKDAGEYTAVVKGVNNPNYYVDEVEFDWEITPKMLLVNWNRTTFIYCGLPMSPHASVNTGIDGETLDLITITDNNINANEDNQVGYKASAVLPDGVKNYTLSNTEINYFILRATPILEITPRQEVLYNGENQLPKYELDGDKNALKIFINDIETSTGVKEIGSYIVKFIYPKSTNYKAMNEEVFVDFIIKTKSINDSLDKMNIFISSPNGFYTSELDIVEITEHFIEIQNEIAKKTDYNLYKAVEINFNEEATDTNIVLSIKRVNASKIKVYELKGRYLKEISCSIGENSISFDGGEGIYYVFVEKSPWISTTGGILTMTAILLLVVIGFVYFTMFKNSHQKQISAMVESKLQEKINNGEEITTEEVIKIRQEVEKELDSRHKKDKNNP